MFILSHCKNCNTCLGCWIGNKFYYENIIKENLYSEPTNVIFHLLCPGKTKNNKLCNTYVGIGFENLCINCFQSGFNRNDFFQWLIVYNQAKKIIFKKNKCKICKHEEIKCSICNSIKFKNDVWFFDNKIF